MSWSVRTAETVIAAVVGAGLLIAGFASDVQGELLGVIAGVGLLALAATDLIWRPRLAADAEGLRIRTPARTAALRWADVDRVRVDERQRFGLTSRTLEIDSGDTLLILGRRSLGTDPRDVAAELDRLRAH